MTEWILVYLIAGGLLAATGTVWCEAENIQTGEVNRLLSVVLSLALWPVFLIMTVTGNHE